MNDYYKIPRLSSSGMGALSRSPAHYMAWMAGEKDTRAMFLGRLFHQSILEPQEYRAAVCHRKRTTEAGKAEYDALIAGGFDVVTAAENDMLEGMRSAVAANSIARDIIATAIATERPNLWIDPDTGAECKGKIDIMGDDGVIWDIKTTAKPASDFHWTIRNYDLNRQGAFYLDGFGSAGFGWIVVEKEPPHGVRVIRASAETIRAGREKYKPLAALYAECCLLGEWPGLGKEIEEI